MNKYTKRAILYFLGVVVSTALSFYAFWSAIFYAWMNANGSWPAEKAAPWAYGSLALSGLFFVGFVYFIVKMVKLRKASNAT
jgi:hypothetical protein